MDLLRRHLFLIVCGLAGVGGIALGLTGMRAMPEVQKKLENAASLHRNLGSLQSNPVNRERIAAEQERVDLILSDHQRILEHAGRLYEGYDLLVPEVLPYGTPVARLEFRRKYGETMRAMFESLTSGQPASDAEIGMWRKRIEEEQLAGEAGGGRAEGAALRGHQAGCRGPRPSGGGPARVLLRDTFSGGSEEGRGPGAQPLFRSDHGVGGHG